jgi:hypothetical protein
MSRAERPNAAACSVSHSRAMVSGAPLRLPLRNPPATSMLRGVPVAFQVTSAPRSDPSAVRCAVVGATAPSPARVSKARVGSSSPPSGRTSASLAEARRSRTGPVVGAVDCAACESVGVAIREAARPASAILRERNTWGPWG